MMYFGTVKQLEKEKVKRTSYLVLFLYSIEFIFSS